MENPGNNLKVIETENDYEFAKRIKEELIKAYEPICKIAEEADARGFALNSTLGKTAMGKMQLVHLQIIKIFNV